MNVLQWYKNGVGKYWVADVTDSNRKEGPLPVTAVGLPTSTGQATMANSTPVVIASDQSAVPVDTELPAAVALSDALANPTAPQVGSHLLGWDATNTL